MCSFGPGVAHRSSRVNASATRHRAMRSWGLDTARALGAGLVRWPAGCAGQSVPRSTVAIPEPGIKSGEHFAHQRDDRHLRLLARGYETTVKGAQCRVEPERGRAGM
jgi:hypothetical protein